MKDFDLKKASDVLRNEGIIIFPTDTAFGIGCRIDSDRAIKKLIKIRGRKKNQPFPVLVGSVEMASKYLKKIPKEVFEKLISKYWPGALTIVLACEKEKINPLIRGNGNTLGVRMPNNKKILDLINKVGVPIIGSSANFVGLATPYELTDIDLKIIEKVDFTLEGKCKLKTPSTVIDCSKIPWKILRQGAIEISDINPPTDEEMSKEKNVILQIDTSSNEYISVGIKIRKKQYVNKQKINYQKAQAVLPMIEKILKKHRMNLNNLSEIKVNTGPGSYTGLRVGLSIANSLSHFLKIPINGNLRSVEPAYK